MTHDEKNENEMKMTENTTYKYTPDKTLCLHYGFQKRLETKTIAFANDIEDRIVIRNRVRGK